MGDRFGAALTAVPLGGEVWFLAVGAPGETLAGAAGAGAANVFYSRGGQLSGSSQVLEQVNPEAGDRFGAVLSPNLSVGAPGEDVGGKVDAGAVNLFEVVGPEGAHFPVQEPSRVILQPNPEAGDQFGAAVAQGNFSASGVDLAVGAPGEDVGGTVNAGAVNVLYGGTSGLVGRNQLLIQGSPGVAGLAEVGDGFGSRLADPFGGNDFNGDGVGDLAIGAPGEDLGAVVNAGAVNVLDGAAGTGLSGSGGRLLTQDSPGVGGQAEPGDAFGSDLD